MAEKLVKIRFMRTVGEHVAGNEVEVSQEEADRLCTPTEVHNGHGLEQVYKAMKVSDIEEMEKQPVDMRKISQHELDMLGKKNVVATPVDPAYESRAAAIKQADEDWVENKKAEAQNKKGKGKGKSKDSEEEPKE